MWVDTDCSVSHHTRMTAHHFTRIVYADFQPNELEKITGMKPALIRDWRRRNLIHSSLDRTEAGFSAPAVAELLLLARLSEHGIGPKRVYGWTRAFAAMVLYYALDDVRAWAGNEGWQAWEAGGIAWNSHSPYLALYQPPNGLRALSSLDALLAEGEDLATVVNLEALGNHLREAAGRPLAQVEQDSGEELG